MSLTPRERTILAGIYEMPGHHTARKVHRIFYVANDAYKVVFRLWRKGLIRAPWLRLYATDAGLKALQENSNER